MAVLNSDQDLKISTRSLLCLFHYNRNIIKIMAN